ncbi:hypothetical protein CARUB_v10014188mg, partial [Capsella rubella]
SEPNQQRALTSIFCFLFYFDLIISTLVKSCVLVGIVIVSAHTISFLFLSFFCFSNPLSPSMASCSLGVPKIKISAVDLSRVRSGSLLIPFNQRSLLGQKPVKYLSLRTTFGTVKAVQVSTVPAPETSATIEVEDSDETKSSKLNAQLVPKPSEVEALVTEICDTSSIAEFELKLGGFRLYVARDLADKSSPQPHATPAVAATSETTNSTDSNGSAPSTSLAITRPASSAADKGLMILQSPKVGFFRRSKTIKGKRMPSSCKEVPVFLNKREVFDIMREITDYPLICFCFI